MTDSSTSYNVKLIKDKLEIQQVVDFQKEIWGEENVTPLAHLMASIHNGGFLIGAFHDTYLVGFCYGFPGYKKGENYIVSHMMAVNETIRSSGIGFRLKKEQKKWALEQGISKIIWTFDPLESRNAYLNIHKLGGYIKTYLPNYYGEMDDDLNRGMPSDRFLLEWDLHRIPINTSSYPMESIIQFHQLIPLKIENKEKWDAVYYKVPVPKDIHKIKQQDFTIAKKWRTLIGCCFQELFKLGYEIVDFQKTDDSVNYYIVKKRR
ncbi:GNAT family N-acetyltransferase [Niallia sp. 03133]|uniref:GNAT family N-acetyltransferase n=1 Tax=Niallia sp. 03133 TaxID=3458060 RepID=UPI004044E6D8